MSGRRHPKPAPGPWAAFGNCVGLDSDLFFPEKHDGGVVTEQARAVCRDCVVVADCLRHALDNYEVHGVWGGTSPVERRRIWRRQRHLRSAS